MENGREVFELLDSDEEMEPIDSPGTRTAAIEDKGMSSDTLVGDFGDSDDEGEPSFLFSQILWVTD